MAYINQDPSGITIVGAGESAFAPVDPAAVAVVWTNGTGFSGSPVVANQVTSRFGNLVSCTFTVTGLTVAAGQCLGTITLPLPRYAPFTETQQGDGLAAGTNSTAGALAAGRGHALVQIGPDTFAYAVANNTGGSLVLNRGLQCTLRYSLV